MNIFKISTNYNLFFYLIKNINDKKYAFASVIEEMCKLNKNGEVQSTL